MKKILALAISASVFGAMPMMAQEATPAQSSTSKVLYDFKKYDAMEMIKFFKELNDAGKNFPTAEEFKAKFGVEVELVRSHVRKRNVLKWKDGKDPLNYGRREGRTVFMNLPTGIGKGIGGYTSGTFDNDPYTLWQYADLFGAWNHGLFQAPGAWAATAHKHGVDMMSGIMFFDTTGGRKGDSAEYLKFISEKKADGSYAYVKPIINALMYLGLDGINYNWEASGLYNENAIAFHQALRDYADEVGFTNYRQAIYASYSTLNQDYANAWLWNAKTKKHTADIMLNYNGEYATEESARIAEEMTGSLDHLYQGKWIVNMNPFFFERMEETDKTNLCLWGEHGMSRFVSNNVGASATEKMTNLQNSFERAFSGGSRNVGVKDPWTASDWDDANAEKNLATFGGISRMIAERSTLEQNLPFRTFFNTGAGERYFYKGKSSSLGGWYDMAAQDLQPTYRWLQYKQGTKEAINPVQVEYSYEDAYIGGSSLQFNGAGNIDVILYRGLITVGDANPKAKLAFKAFDESKKDNGLVLLLHKQGAADTDYVTVAFDDLKDKTWEEQEKAISGLAKGDVIDLIGIRMTKEANIYLGELAIFDDAVASETPSLPINLKAEVKEEKVKSLSAMLSWSVEQQEGKTPTREANGLLYNDEAGVHHFEILFKEGANGAVREIGRTESWSTYAPKVMFEKAGEDSEEPYFGVRSVANDLKTVSDITWIKVSRQASFDLPEEDRYCTSELDPNSALADVARQIRYLDLVKTTGAKVDLNYTSETPDEDGNNYVYHKSDFTVEQGSAIDFTFRANGRDTSEGSPTRDGLMWCYGATYIDWNNDGKFDAQSDERITELDLGTAKKGSPEFQEEGFTKTFNVPKDATPGKVRVRIVFTDAWFPTPTPCGLTYKGFTFDFDMTIIGDNPGRPSSDKHDAGEPEAPEAGINKAVKTTALTLPTAENGTIEFVNVPDASKVAIGSEVMLNVEPAKGFVLETLTVNGKDIKATKKFIVGEQNDIKVVFKKSTAIEDLDNEDISSFYPNPATSVVTFKNTDTAWIYSLEGKLVLIVKDTTKPVDVSSLPAGTYVVKAERYNVTRSYKLIKK